MLAGWYEQYLAIYDYRYLLYNFNHKKLSELPLTSAEIWPGEKASVGTKTKPSTGPKIMFAASTNVG